MLVAAAAAKAADMPRAEGEQGPLRDFWQPRYMWGGDVVSPSAKARMQRHWTYMHSGVPPAYRRQSPPFKPTAEEIGRGRLFYTEHCGGCHRMDGMGGGDSALGLAPSPALLAYLIQRPAAADEYLLWTISEGGAMFDTPMPGFKDTLSRDEIWSIIAFMRAGFPAPDPAPPNSAPPDSARPEPRR
mgnify:CR=1 FL=1